ncbi:MAG: TRAP transporter substrate-binding protein [Pseudomonadota bacterium]
MRQRHLALSAAAGAIALTAMVGAAAAQDVTLRLHQFLPPVATVPAKILKPWGESLAAASDGRIEVQHFDAMALGGRPPELMDQARDGVVDITMTIVGYTPGRFPRTEVFELPFTMLDPVGTSLAFWEMVETDFQENEYADVKVLGAWVHGPGVIHSADPITKLEDMAGKTVRGPTRVINDMLAELGATPVGMPLPAIPESLSKGVINATVIPWEVTPAIRLTELVTNHTEFTGPEALYTATIVLVMNKAKYEALPDDLKAIVDAESGAKLSGMAAAIMHKADVPTRAIAEKANNNIIQLDEAEVARWKAAAAPVVDRWVAEMDDKGIGGAALIDQAKKLIAANSK